MPYTPPPRQSVRAQAPRHYRGAGLGTLKSWTCPACGVANAGRALSEGCTACGAGAGGQQVRRPGEPLKKLDGEGRVELPRPTPAARTSTVRPGETGVQPHAVPSSLSSQLRARASSVDYDEIERRVARVLERRLGGGYTPAERQTLYNALECYLTLWEDGTIAPETGLPLEATRRLADRVVSDDLEQLEENEATADGISPTTTTTGNDPERAEADAGDSSDTAPDSAAAGESHGGVPPGDARPAPQFLDVDHRGDEVGEDDPPRDGG